MSPMSDREKFQVVRNRIRMAQDALTRSMDGIDWDNWRSLTMGYSVAQLAKAIDYASEAIARCNAEMNGEHEGQPTEILLDPTPTKES